MRQGMVVTSALVLALLASGCSPGRGKFTSEALQRANDRVTGLKSANEYQSAWQAYSSGDLEKASKAIDRSITLNPSVAKSYVLRGRIEIERGQLEDSIESFKKAEALDPASVDAQYYMAIVFERFGQSEDALARYTKAAEIDPTNPQYALASAEVMIDMGRLDEADEFLATRTASFQHNAGVRQTLGHIAMMRGDAERAATLFAEARLLAPDDTGILEDLINAQIATGKFADAEFNLSRLLSSPVNKERRDLKHLRARCLVELDRPLEAREIYSELTSDAAGGKDVEAWIGLGNTAYVLRDMLRLRQASQRVVALDAQRPEGHILRAWFQLRTDQHDAALASLDKAIEHRGELVDPLLLKATVLKDMGRFDDARAVITAALAEMPGNVQLARQLEAFDQELQETAITGAEDVPAPAGE